MSSRQLTLILIVAVVLGGIGWVLFNRGASSWESRPAAEGEKVVTFPLNDVARITIKDPTTELNLVQKEDQWVIRERADYPANFEQVSRLLQKIWELKPVQELKVGPSQFTRFNLTEPGAGANGGTLLDLKNKDAKRIAALLIGKEYLKKSAQRVGSRDTFPAGRYVMPEDGSKRVALVSDPLGDVTTKPERWLNHEFLKIEKPKTIALTSVTPAMNWKLLRDTESEPWKFADAKPGEDADPPRTAGLASVFGHMTFTDVLDPTAKPDSTGLDKPSIITIDTFDGFSYSLKIGKLNGTNYPVAATVAANLPTQRTVGPNEKAEDKKKLDEEFENKKKASEDKLTKEKKLEGRPYLMAKPTIDQMLKNRSDFVKPPPTPTPSPASSGQTPPAVKPSRPFPLRTPHTATPAPSKP